MTARTPMTKVDTAWLHMDSPTNHMVVTSVLLFDTPVDVQRLRRVMAVRLLRLDRFRQRVVTPLRTLRAPQWEDDPFFDLDAHVHRLALPAPGGDAELQTLVGELMSTPLDLSIPLWQTYVVDGYGSGSAVITRIHHCVADGIALVKVLLSLTDTTAEADVTPAHETWHATRSSGLGALPPLQLAPRAAELGLHAIAGLASLVRVSLIPNEPPTALSGELGVRKRAVWSGPIPLDTVKSIGRSVGATVNDVLMAAATGALRRYLVLRRDDVDGIELHATVPVNLRGDEPEMSLGNRFGLVYPALPIGIADPLQRLRAVKQRMDALKETPEAVMAIVMLDLMGRTPQPVENVALGFFTAKSSSVLTNVPGPRQVHYLAGAPLRRILVWAPPSGGLPMSISIFSYAGDVTVGVATDAGLIPDPETIVAAFHHELAALGAAGRHNRSHRQMNNGGDTTMETATAGDPNDRLLLILDAQSRALVGQCSGPGRGGVCPAVAKGDVVPCAGRRIVPARGTGIEGWRLTVVDPELKSCPLSWAVG